MYMIVNPNGMFSAPIQGVIPERVVQRPNGYVAVLDTTDMIAELVRYQQLQRVYETSFSQCNFVSVKEGGFRTSTLVSVRDVGGHKLIYNTSDGFLWDVWATGRRRLFQGTKRGVFCYAHRINGVDPFVVERVMLLYNGIWYPGDIIYDDDNVPVHWECNYLPSSVAFNTPMNYKTMDYLEGVL